MSGYASGRNSKAMCPRCGQKAPYKDLQQEWTGYWVCPVCYDPKHEQLEPREYIHDPQSLDHPYVDNDNDGAVPAPLSDTITMTHGDT